MSTTRFGAVLRVASIVLSILTLAWIASALATGGASHHLINARASHTATAQFDGSLLIAGGTGNRGVLKSLEFFDPVSGKSTPGPRLFEARSGHSAIALADGRVLLTGGRNDDGALLASSEIYDAAGGALNPGASMGHARANHTSTLLADGRVLIAGGDAEGRAEIYDPATDRFVDAGRLAVARSGHSSVRLGDGRVLLVGGYGAAGATAEIFDPKTNTFSTVRGGLKTARVQPTLKLISDGKVQVYGGDAEITMEVYNPAGYFSSRGHLLRDSSMFRAVMYSPGQAALIAIPSAKGKHYAENALGPAAGEFERTAHTATEVAARSTMVVVGGFGTTGAALDTITELGSCGGTVTTDLTDYMPGETVIMSGSGWAPGEQITLNLHRDTNDPPDTTLYASADENGDWVNAEYVVQEYDLGVTFVLTATGDSGCSAQTTFTDGGSFTYSPSSASLTVAAGGSDSFAQSVTGPSGNGTFSATVQVAGTGPNQIPAGWISTSPSSLSFNTTSGTDIETWTVFVTVPSGTAAGTYTANIKANASVPGVGVGPGTSLSVTVTAVQATVTTVASSLNPSTYGDNVTFTATVKAGANPVTTGSVTFIEGGTCAVPTTVLGGPTTLNGSGQAAFSTATLTASASPHTIVACYGGTASFAASSGSVSQVVNKAQLTVTADDKSRAYGSANPTFTYVISGFVNGDTEATAVTGTASCTTTATQSSAAGSYPITCALGTLAAANYTFTFVAGTLTVNKVQLTVTADDKSKTYGDPNPTLTYTITGFVNGDTAATAVTGTANCTTTATQSSATGSYPITCALGTLAATSYTFTFVAGTLTVNKAQLTVTADDKSKTYGDANPTLTYTITGFVNGDTAATAVTGTANCTTTALTGSPVGGYPITCTIGSLAATNYTFTFVAGTLTVNPALLTVTADNKVKTYGDANPTLTYTITGFVNGDTAATAVTGTANCTTTALTGSPVGGYPITCTIGSLAATNYTFTFVAGTLTINPALLTVTADNKVKTYGSPNPALTYVITGFVNGDTIAAVSGSASCSTTATAGSPVGGYPITCTQGSLSATNYTFTFVAGTLTINPALLTVTADNKIKTYGSPNPALTYTISGFVNGDTIAVVSGTASCSTTATTGSPVGNYPIACMQGSLSAANYTFTFVAGTLTVNPALLTVTADNKVKIYGSPNPALTYVITGFVNGDTIAVVSGTASCSTVPAGSPVGTYPITCTQGTLAATNYTFTFVAGTLTINPALLTVTATSTSKLFGDLNPVFGYTITGFVNGDTIAVVSGVPNCTTTATQFSPIGTYPITCTIGTLSAANYTFTFVGATLTINPRGALVNYIGQQVFVTSGSSSTTAQVTLSASVQDPTGLGLSGAKVDFIDCSSSCPGKTLASGVPVSPVQNQGDFTGTANTVVTLSTGQFGSQSYQILVKMTGNYDNSAQPVPDKTATVVVMQPAATYQTIGGGMFQALGARAGIYAGSNVEPSFSVGMTYNKSLTNLKGQISLTIYQADGIVYVKSNSISSMAITGSGNSQSATIYTKSSMYEVLNNGTTVAIDGNVTLRMDIVEGSPAAQVGFTVLSSKDSSLYYSNNWLLTGSPPVWKTVVEGTDNAPVTIN